MTILGDFSTSVTKALSEIDTKWKKYPGLIICGTHTPIVHDIEDMIAKIKNARTFKVPFLGICFGHQLAAVEYARHVLNIIDATSEEFGKGTFIVRARVGGLQVGQHNGQSFWNNYEVDAQYERLWKKPDWFFTTQSHPEYQSSLEKPHPFLVEFLKYAKKHT